MLSLKPCILPLGAGAVLALSVSAGHAQPPQKPPPTHADVAYGPHERNVLDIWLAESEAPTLGKAKERGIMMEVATAVSLLMAGADILVVRHPDTANHIRGLIEELGGK